MKGVQTSCQHPHVEHRTYIVEYGQQNEVYCEDCGTILDKWLR